MTPQQPLGPVVTMHKGLEKRGRPRKDDGSLVVDYERAVSSAADGIVKAHHSVTEAVGNRPFRKNKISEVDQLHRYLVIRNNPLLWGALLQSQGQGKTIKYALKMEELYDRYPDHQKLLEPDAQ